MTYVFSGSGPGIQTPDGCSVDLYRRLPYMGELEDIADQLAQHAPVLELGCGTGRLCTRLLELGHTVTGVDESAEMLAHLPTKAEGILSTIESLSLGRRWPVVLLPSHLINHPDETVRRAFVHAAHLHLAPGGTFFIKRHHPGWLANVQPGPVGESRGVAIHVDEVIRQASRVALKIRYEAFGQAWLQSFTTVSLSEAEIEELLRAAGFELFQWHGQQRLWCSAAARDAVRSSTAPVTAY